MPIKKSDFVIIRTKSAGVHAGTFVNFKDGVATLKDSRRVWRWRGANSLSELANNGCDQSYSRISEPVSKIMIPEVIEVLYCTKKAKDNLSVSRWGA